MEYSLNQQKILNSQQRIQTIESVFLYSFYQFKKNTVLL